MDPNPLDVVAEELYRASACTMKMKDALIEELEEDCVLNNNGGSPRNSINDLYRAEKEHLAMAAEEGSKDEIKI